MTAIRPCFHVLAAATALLALASSVPVRADTDPDHQPLPKETLVAMPQQLCAFVFSDVSRWRVVGKPVAATAATST